MWGVCFQKPCLSITEVNPSVGLQPFVMSGAWTNKYSVSVCRRAHDAINTYDDILLVNKSIFSFKKTQMETTWSTVPIITTASPSMCLCCLGAFTAWTVTPAKQAFSNFSMFGVLNATRHCWCMWLIQQRSHWFLLWRLINHSQIFLVSCPMYTAHFFFLSTSVDTFFRNVDCWFQLFCSMFQWLNINLICRQNVHSSLSNVCIHRNNFTPEMDRNGFALPCKPISTRYRG